MEIVGLNEVDRYRIAVKGVGLENDDCGWADLNIVGNGLCWM